MKNTFRYLVFTFSLLAGCINFDKIPAEKHSKVNELLTQLIDENQIPGIYLSIIYPNNEQKNYSAGYANLEEKIAMSPKNVMFSGSIGKTYAVAVLMQLVDEGKIDLNSRFIDYFPENQWLIKIPNINELTILMLLQHRTGLPRYEMKPEVWDSLYLNPEKIWSYEDRLSIIFNDQPIHKPNEGWSYSDTNYILLGMLIEKVSENDYYNEVSKRILIPLGLKNTHAAITRKIKGLPVGYSQLPEWFKMPIRVVENGTYAFNPQMEWTGGGMASTTADLALWAKQYYVGNLFSDSLHSLMITPCEMGKDVMPNMSYGTGSFIFATEHGDAYGHTGFVPGFNSIFAYFPEQNIAIAMQINCDYSTQKMSLIGYFNKIMAVIKN